MSCVQRKLINSILLVIVSNSIVILFMMVLRMLKTMFDKHNFLSMLTLKTESWNRTC